MDFIVGSDFQDCWDATIFFDPDEFNSWGLDDAFSGDYDSTDGPASAAAVKKSISLEKERRKKFNEKLYTLRSLVPSITKMDKISIVKDAIDYIVDLQEQERKLIAEISDLEKESGKKRVDVDGCAVWKRRRVELIDVTELQVSDAGDSTCVVSISCSRKRDTMTRLCQALEFLPLRILSANITSFSGSVLHTLLLETEGTDGTHIKDAIHAALTGF
ncbi:transcription factor bHLH35-like [Wolffia australiana]